MRGLLTKLSDREEDIMSILWNTDKSLTATEIFHCNEEISKNTIQVVLRNLLKKEYIKVSDVVYSGTTLSRSYTYVITAEEYAADQLQALKNTTFNFSHTSFLEYMKKYGNQDIIDGLKENA
ncbi:BlaI/MecI/CopY family transcriptional regulator [Peptostreptococcus sp. MV1]|uniref:BlaI/MecI/CopY family transcriptional regulator n=1 Tax=Peptostreptococcus sp. MV1 TaxID=1219626 RepID=UPI00068FD9FD|nr:BlaI/MecI/CopY family transcriptional regulator [Peptostreptococcus sp. MV1]